MPSGLVVAGVLGLIIIGLYLKDRKDRKDENQNHEVAPDITDSVAINQPPVRRVVVNADFLLSLTSKVGGDPNEAGDMGKMLALFQEYNFRPLAILVGYTHGGVGVGACKQVIMESGLDIPVLSGATSYKPSASEASQFIADESHKGKLHVLNGGPVNDLRDAKRLGANGNNITCLGIVRGTWNYTTTSQTEADTVSAGQEVYAWLGSSMVDVEGYREFIKAPLGNQFNRDWVNTVRSQSRLARMVYSQFLNEWCAYMNRGEAQGNILRNGDIHILLEYLNLGRKDGNYKDLCEIWRKGYAGLEQRPTLARLTHPVINVGVPEVIEDRSPTKQSDINLSNVVMVDTNGNPYGWANPLSYRETSIVTDARFTLTRSVINHSEKSKWPDVKDTHNGTIITFNSNITVIYYDQSDGKTKAIPFEYLRSGTTDMVHGTSKASLSIREGDVIGVMASYIYRNGTYANAQGNPKLRSNVKFITVG